MHSPLIRLKTRVTSYTPKTHYSLSKELGMVKVRAIFILYEEAKAIVHKVEKAALIPQCQRFYS